MNVAYNIVKEEATAEDICHDVFLRLYQRRDQIDPTNERKLNALIFYATVNKSRDYYKKAYVKHEYFAGAKSREPISNSSNPEQIVLRKEEVRYRKKALANLRERNRQNYNLLIDSELNGIRPKDMAQKNGLKRTNVNNRISKTRKWLKQELKKIAQITIEVICANFF